MSLKPSIVWFRQDLRVEDQPALTAAIQKGGAIIPLYIWAPDEEGEWSPGAASRWWIHYSLLALQQELKQLGLTLIIRRGSSLPILLDLIQLTDADRVFWTRRYEPLMVQRDAFIKAELQKQGIKTDQCNSLLLFEPWTVFNKLHKPFQVFAPFWRQCLHTGDPALPLPKPSEAKHFIGEIDSEEVVSLGLLPKVHWDTGLKKTWQPGAQGAQSTLKHAIEAVIPHYQQRRDRPDLDNISHLSPYLHHGNISPRLIWHAVQTHFDWEDPNAQSFLRQLGWREFGYYLLYHFPYTTHEPLRKDFHSFPWKENYQALRAWQNGKTGYPLVDAGMRQLWTTGWMHNRVRMIVASFLVKDLLIRWQEGAKWFWDTLVDADLASNTLGWQWIAGCGADAVPYFRVFNPITQGDKFDVSGEYVRKWIPELQGLPDQWIHKPWEAPEEVLQQAGVILGETYPYPIVDHMQAREQALEAYAKL